MSKINWKGFKDLPKETDFLLDTGRIQKKMDRLNSQPLQRKTMTFHIPSDMRPEQRERVAKEKIGQGLRHMDREGWRLHSDLEVFGPFPCTDPVTNLPILGEREYRVRAVFQYMPTPKPIRIPLDPRIVKQDPEHKITVKQAARALSLKLPLPARN